MKLRLILPECFVLNIFERFVRDRTISFTFKPLLQVISEHRTSCVNDMR